jgi:hypothetical protein
MFEKIKNFFKLIWNKIVEFFKSVGKKCSEFAKLVVKRITDFVKEVKKDPKVALVLLRNLTLLAGVLLVAFVGVYFILQTDLALKNSNWQVYKMLKKEDANQLEVVSKGKSFALTISILLSFGGAVLLGLSETLRHKPVVVYIMKGLALVLCVLFIIYISGFDTNYLTKAGIKVFVKEAIELKTLILAYIGAAVVAINIACNAILGVKE